MPAKPSQPPAARYDRAWRSANDAEARYLTAVSAGTDSKQLAALAAQACDLWSDVVVVCGGFEAVAREKIVSPPLVNRPQPLHQAWTEFSHWRGLCHDASAQAQLFAALTSAHLGTLPATTHNVVRLDAVQR
jgi:hypothetical protein